MRPGPRLRQVRQFRGRTCRGLDGESVRTAVKRHAFLNANDNQAQPWPKLVLRVLNVWREQPWQRGAIELDGSKQLRFDVGSAVHRFGTYDLRLVDADDVTRTKHSKRHIYRA